MTDIDYSKYNAYNRKDYSLDRIKKIAKAMKNPQDRMGKNIYVTGTNGKGSTISFIKTILNNLGFTCNVYTSPHLVSITERIIIKDKEIDPLYLDMIIKKIQLVELSELKDESLSFFERLTLAGFIAFSENQADFNLIEVGIGGRLDATNIIESAICSVITSISYDHMDYLGNTIDEISYDKSFIIKPNSICVVSRQVHHETVISNCLDKCKKLNSSIVIYGKDFFAKIKEDSWDFYMPSLSEDPINLDFPSLKGDYQIYNASTAIAVVCSILKISLIENEKVIKESIAKTRWPGRLETIKYKGHSFILDGAHNEDGVRNLRLWINNLEVKKLKCLICAMKSDKDFEAFFQYFQDFDLIICIKIQIPHIQFHEPYELVQKISSINWKTKYLADQDKVYEIENNLEKQIRYYDNFLEAMNSIDLDKYFVVCTGSLFLVSDIYRTLNLKAKN